MTELDLLAFARSAVQNEISLFTQVITITFAMIVGIYYFLNQARFMMKLFAFIAYLIGALLFLARCCLKPTCVSRRWPNCRNCRTRRRSCSVMLICMEAG